MIDEQIEQEVAHVMREARAIVRETVGYRVHARHIWLTPASNNIDDGFIVHFQKRREFARSACVYRVFMSRDAYEHYELLRKRAC